MPDTLYKIIVRETLWTNCPSVEITFVAESRNSHWMNWIESSGLDVESEPVLAADPEPHIIHEAWTPAGDRRDWSKLDFYFWQQSSDYANQLFTSAEADALKPYIEQQFDYVDIEPVTLPIADAAHPLDTIDLRSRIILKSIPSATIRLNNCDFHCDVIGYYNQIEYETACNLSRLMPQQPSVIDQQVTVQYNPDEAGYYFIVENDHTIYKMSLPKYPTAEAAKQAARQYMF